MQKLSFVKLCLLASVLVCSCGLTAAQTIGFGDQNQLPDYATPDSDSASQIRFPVLGYTNWSAPYNLGSPINTPALDGCPFISSDGLALLFVTNRATGSLDLYISQRPSRNWSWGIPVSLGPDINTAAYEEFCPTLTNDGRYLFFVSNRPGGCGGADLYITQRLDDSYTEWSEPQNLGCQADNKPNSTGVELASTLFEDRDGSVYLYFSSGLRPGGMGFGDIYVSQLQADGTFGPASPVMEFNTPFNEIRPNIRQDGLEIFFDSNRPGTFGLQDLYVSTRACTSCSWSPPVNLGPTVNSSSVDGRPSLSFDGTELYFMSNRPGGLGDQDIYAISRRKLTRGLLGK